jgi:L-2-hydroxyglutarate oxidase LhgO
MRSIVANNVHDFGSILKSEWPKIIESQLVKESLSLVPSASQVSKWQRKPPGIRAQLVHLPTGNLEQDFVVKSSSNSTHILNAVSPGWTSAIPFGRYIAEQISI